MTLPPLTIHPPAARPHRARGKAFPSLHTAEHRAGRLARRADCERRIYAHPAGGPPVLLATVQPGGRTNRTGAGRDRARIERTGP